ncbi:MAG: histidine phosphatase family protein [Clostridia bacterium]|nr:histidine phosphatase family protein [Clostridia bacterium]
MRILIIRHGDPDYANDCLTEKGKREAALLAEKLKKEKIDHIYSSPLGRAKQTCETYARAVHRENEIVVKDWLREFNHPVTLPSGRAHGLPWDMLPEEWVNEPELYRHDEWFNHACYQGSGLKEKYLGVISDLDALIAEHGYTRDGNIYRVEKRNRDTIALFCHFGLEGVLLSRLCNVSPVVIWHNFVALTTSVTTLYTEERRDSKAVFRCAGFGDVGHLYAGEEQPSFSARFCETVDCENERHD